MRRDQRIYVLTMVVLLFVLVAAIGQRVLESFAPQPTLSADEQDSATASAQLAQARETHTASGLTPVTVSVASSNTKEDWINAVASQFNGENHTTTTGSPVLIDVTHVTSGGSQTGILNGELTPVVWSPGDYSWVESANEVWRDRTGRPLVSETCQQTVFAPIGFAMWRPMAEALGWPDRPVGWDDIIALMADPDGWASVGHPEWGTFKFGHTHPQYSNVGMLMMASVAYQAAGKTADLTTDEVYSDAVEAAFRQVELNTYHYGIQSRDLLRLMVTRGPQYLHAVTTSEAEALKTNAENSDQLRFPLVFIFPSDGTFWGEHPYCVLDGEWVTDEQREAAELFRDYLLEPNQQTLAIANYLRPVDTSIPLAAPLTQENGTDPDVTPAIVPGLSPPSGSVVNAVIDMFHRTKKPATVLLVIDTSGSMNGARIQNAVTSAVQFVGRLAPNDDIYVYGFANNPYLVGLGGRVSQVEEALVPVLSGLYAAGDTAIYDAVCMVAGRVEQLRQEHIARGDPHLYGIVLLSDGEDTSSRQSVNQMFECLPSGENADSVRVFAIGYEVTNEGFRDILQRMASRTNGRYFDGSTANIDSIYNAISAEQ